MWASFSHEDASDDLGTKNLTRKEMSKVWKLIDALELEKRKTGKKDEDEGYVMLRMREPGGEDGHDSKTVYISRANDDEDVISLADYLRTLVGRYRKEKPNF